MWPSLLATPHSLRVTVQSVVYLELLRPAVTFHVFFCSIRQQIQGEWIVVNIHGALHG